MSFAIRLLWLAALCVASAACSDAVSLASEGAYLVYFKQSASSGRMCNIVSHNSNVGTVDSTVVGLLLKDTVRGAKMECSVSAAGAGVQAVGVLQDAEARYLDFRIGAITTAATKMQPVTGNIGYRSPATVNLFRAPGDPPCKFYLNTKQAGQLATGKIWVDFECPEIHYDGANQGCEITGGTIAMQNCTQ